MQKLDGTGTVVMNVEYDPFGNVISGTLPVGEYGFSTKPLIEGIQMYYYGFRYYDPVTGRWPSRDPMGENWLSGEFNPYSFITNEPLFHIDLLGLRKQQSNTNPEGTTNPSGGSSVLGNATTAKDILGPPAKAALNNPGKTISGKLVGKKIAGNLNPANSPTFVITGIVLPALEEMSSLFCAFWNKGKTEYWNEPNRRCRIVCKECPEQVFGVVRKGNYSRITERRCDGLQWITKRIWKTQPCSAKCPSSKPHQDGLIYE